MTSLAVSGTGEGDLTWKSLESRVPELCTHCMDCVTAGPLAWNPNSETAAPGVEHCSAKDLLLQKGAQPHGSEGTWPHQPASANGPSQLPLPPHASPPGSLPRRQPPGSGGTMPSTEHTRRSILDCMASIWGHFPSLPTLQMRTLKFCLGHTGGNPQRPPGLSCVTEEAWPAHGPWLVAAEWFPGHVSHTRDKRRWGSLHPFPPCS